MNNEQEMKVYNPYPDLHKEHLEKIIQELEQVTSTDTLFTSEGDSVIDSAIVQLSLLKYSGDSDADEFTLIGHFHRLLVGTLLEMLRYSQGE